MADVAEWYLRLGIAGVSCEKIYKPISPHVAHHAPSKLHLVPTLYLVNPPQTAKMRFSTVPLLALSLLTLTTAIPLTNTDDVQRAVWEEQLAQAEYGLAYALDSKNWTALSNYMTADIYYDSSALGPGKGGVYTSLADIIAALKVAWADKSVVHNVPNSYVEAVNGKEAHVYS
jgi:hypothetical protein